MQLMPLSLKFMLGWKRKAFNVLINYNLYNYNHFYSASAGYLSLQIGVKLAPPENNGGTR
ncbi:hypothetical protein GCM10007877_17090 [Marinibactrum halimedae]|uniref:Uncharacterized protein n=1 Tax=Marinibactrum halimedae TaxID=1444977 RepID=A0AA37T2W6_9GAMM|nr:hypothetical protein GCM10007877_17090 [Marinibactrum halimedae]